MMLSAFEELYDYISSLEIVDTHEHLPACEAERDYQTDILREYLQHYFSSDLISAGLSRQDLAFVTDISQPLLKRWDRVEPYWEAARNTGYGRALDLTVQGLYNIPRLDRENIEQADQAFRDSLRPGHFRWVLQEKCGLLISMLDGPLQCDQELFRPVCNIGWLVIPRAMATFRTLEARFDQRITCFADWLEIVQAYLESALEAGAVAFKSALAYQRSLHFPRVTYSQAEEDFNRALDHLTLPEWEEPTLELGSGYENYMFHFILQWLAKRGLTLQVHTGLQEGNGNFITNSNPTLLTNLFMAYGDVKFDLFHIGYPYYAETSALAKNFPNVYIDMCWAHIISPTAATNALTEYLDAVPSNKISAFGGDYIFVDGVYGHQLLARENVAKVLAQKVEDGSFDIDLAKDIAYRLFVQNPIELFGLTDLLE